MCTFILSPSQKCPPNLHIANLHISIETYLKFSDQTHESRSHSTSMTYQYQYHTLQLSIIWELNI